MEDTKERILRSAKDLFRKYGIRSISMDDIAHHLGISKKTIYQHFSDKDGIVTLAIQQVVEEERQALERICNEARNVVEMVLEIHRHIWKRLNEDTAAFLFDLQKYHPKAHQVLTDFKVGFLTGLLTRILEQGIVEGYFRQEMNPNVIARVRLEELSMAANQEIFPRDKFSQREVVWNLLEHFVRGITTEKGTQLYKKYKDFTESKSLSQTNETKI